MPVFSRIMERIIKRKVITYLIDRDLDDFGQHGFPQSKSRSTCMTDFLKIVTKAANDGKSAIVIFVGVTKAFVSVSHRKLLIEVKSYGIPITVLAWVPSYFTSRTQIMRVNGILSNPRPITSGVTEGFLISPLLFLLCINEIFGIIRRGILFLFLFVLKIAYTFLPLT